MHKTSTNIKNLLVNEGNLKNFLSSNPNCLSLCILIKAKYGNSILIGKSFTELSNKLKISNKRLKSILDSPCSEAILEYNDLGFKKIVKTKKINGVGANIRFRIGGKEYFNAKTMEVGLGDPNELTIKKINEALFLIQLAILVSRQNMAQYGVLMLSGNSGPKSGVSFRDDYKVWTGCSIMTMAMKMGMSKYKVRKVIANAVQKGIITKNERKVIYEKKDGAEKGVCRKNGMFRIEYENGKVMEQLSNEYHIGKIRFRMKKSVSKSKLDKATGKIRRWKRPVVKVDPNIQPWGLNHEYSDPDIVGTMIVCKEAGDGNYYAKTDSQKHLIKSLKDSKKPEMRKAAKEIIRSLTENELIMPYVKPEEEKKKALSWIKRLTALHRKSIDYTIQLKPESQAKAQDVSGKFFDGGLYRKYEVIATALAINNYQTKVNKSIDKMKKEKGDECKIYFFRMDDRLVKNMVQDKEYMSNVDKMAIPVLQEFEARFKREDARNEGESNSTIDITMDGLFMYLANMMGEYIYNKRQDALGCNGKAVNYKKYMENKIYGNSSMANGSGTEVTDGLRSSSTL